MKPINKDVDNWLFFPLHERILDFINLLNELTVKHK